MTGTANSFGQEALDFVESLDRLDTPDAVLDAMQGAISRFGFEWVAFSGVLPKPGETMDDLVLAHRSRDGLHDVYTSRDYVRVDPNVRRALHSSRPFEWTWEDYGDEHGPRSTEVMRVLADFTMLRGFFVPVHGSATKLRWHWPARMWSSAPEAQPGLHLMSLYAFERVRQLLAGKPESKPPLTPREREVLAWSAQGKSAREIGTILSVGKRTVDEHAQASLTRSATESAARLTTALTLRRVGASLSQKRRSVGLLMPRLG
jgi:LuxR family transcriptional regulator, quorum-sensing system regulator BjaR1